MLYVFYGTNTHKVADQAHKLVAGLLAKRPDALVFRFEGVVERGEIDALIEARGLFVERHIGVFHSPLEKVEGREVFLSRVERCAASENIFVVIEGKLLAEQKRALAKHATKIEEHTLQVQQEAAFNIFSLSDALSVRDRRMLWLGYVRARRSGVVPENIQGTLHWAVKSLLAARDARTAEEVGQKPTVFSKQKRAAQLFTRTELINLSRTLIEVYHEAHRGTHDLESALERWCLQV
jgi:DNA polymerase III delta subunit